MKYDRFENLPVWKADIERAVNAYSLTDRAAFKGRGDLRDELRRAAPSISSDIAEGFERGTTQELLAFLYTSRGSAGQLRWKLWFCDRLPTMRDLRSEISGLRSLSESISGALRASAEALQNSAIRGQALADRERAPSFSAQARSRGILARATPHSGREHPEDAESLGRRRRIREGE